jgi:tetratricopeptide (TPR) repeat protein
MRDTSSHGERTGPARLVLILCLALGMAVPTRGQDDSLGWEELQELDTQRRRGDVRRAVEELDYLLEELPGEHAARALRARCRLQMGDYDGAETDARGALEGLRAGGNAEVAAMAARTWLELTTELGRPDEGLGALEGTSWLSAEADPRDAWVLGAAQLEAGRREEAEALLRKGIETAAAGWEEGLARARCLRHFGLLERAAQELVAADRQARRDTGVEPDVLVELADVYFEFYGEVDDPVARAHSSADLCREALERCRDHEGALLVLLRLHRFNWMRQSLSPGEVLDQLATARPGSVPGLLARVSAALDDGDLQAARQALAQLEARAPGRRAVRAEAAALAWIEHRREQARAALDRLAEEDPRDAAPDLIVGRHLLELYRFAEARPFLEQAVARDERSPEAWTQLGRAQANTGAEDEARESLARSLEVGEGRKDAWRDNTRLVLKRMEESMVAEEHGSLRFLWPADEAEVLRAYYPDFYGAAREELSARYGHTPGRTQIEVFRRWEDFSVRSTGFQGYPALGVCFGPVVTAVSPLCELRGTFSWARTSFHEFTHVVHLGLSHNRCPRWVTEGLATWEEGERSPAWWRNLRRDLVDARANGTILPVRRLNAAFRGPRVIFAYYQSGLLCQMLVDEHGFAPMVRLLEAFDRGADLDGALREVFAVTPEELDRRFTAKVDEVLENLAIEPRWSPESTFRRRFGLARQPPAEGAGREGWAREWCRVAWGTWIQGKALDAEEALRLASSAGDLPASGHFLRGEMLLGQTRAADAREAFEAGFAAGGEDYRARMALGSLLARAGEHEQALRQFRAAERAFPGFDSPHFSAELEQARIYDQLRDEASANQARLRWLAWNSGNYPVRVKVAEWLVREGRTDESLDLWREANEVDPFRRHLHLSWGRALASLGRHEEALREFRVGLAVTLELDGDVVQGSLENLSREQVSELTGLSPEELDEHEPEEVQALLRARLAAGNPLEGGPFVKRFHDEEPLLWGHLAGAALDLDRPAEAREAIEKALVLDPGCAPALEARKRLE